jgi:GTP cyclohydrolase I
MPGFTQTSSAGSSSLKIFEPNAISSRTSALKKELVDMDAYVENKIDPNEEGRPSRHEAEEAVRTLLKWAGEDPWREGLRDTPSRVANAYGELFGGYGQMPEDILSRTFEDVAGYKDLVVVKDIPFFSHCEHHMVPFFGKAHVAYQPSGRVLGLSKIARLVDLYARRLQTQEALTAQVARSLDDVARAMGVAVMIEAEHMCMAMRGIRKQGAKTLTMSFTGSFEHDAAQQARFMMLVRG